MGETSVANVTDQICQQLAKLLEDSDIRMDDIRPESSLVDDLGLDSLKFVDLTLALEDVFGLSKFPMQDWVDREAQKRQPAFTVSALAEVCLEQLRVARDQPMNVIQN